MNIKESAAIPAAKSAATPSIEFLRDLAEVLEKHKGGITFVSDDRFVSGDSYESGFYVTQGDGWDAWKSRVWIGWSENGSSDIRKVIEKLEAEQAEKSAEKSPETEQEVFDTLYKKEWQEQSMREEEIEEYNTSLTWDDGMLNDDDYK